MLLAALSLTLLHGTVTMGPITPVCTVGVPCDKRAAHVRLTFTRPGRVVRTTTDAKGLYRLPLASGTWTVSANVGMSLRPRTIVVPRARTALRNFSIDTGIR